MRRVTVTRRYHLPALHILSGPSLSPDDNFRVFGPCSRLHGHDYQIEVTLAGPVDPDSGLVVGRDELDLLVRRNLLEPYRGTNLSSYFTHTTGEALALEFFRILESTLPPTLHLEKLTLRETAKNSFVVHRPGSRIPGTGEPSATSSTLP